MNTRIITKDIIDEDVIKTLDKNERNQNALIKVFKA